MTNIPNGEDLLNRARAAYQRSCERNGYDPIQPCAGRSEVDGDTVTLRNVNGTLARYRWTGTRLEMCENDE